MRVGILVWLAGVQYTIRDEFDEDSPYQFPYQRPSAMRAGVPEPTPTSTPAPNPFKPDRVLPDAPEAQVKAVPCHSAGFITSLQLLGDR